MRQFCICIYHKVQKGWATLGWYRSYLTFEWWLLSCIITVVKKEQIAAIFPNDPLPYTTDKWDWSGGNKNLNWGKYFFSDLVKAEILGKIRFSLCEKAEGVGEYGHSPFYVGWSRCSEAIKVIYWSERGSCIILFLYFFSCCICICNCFMLYFYLYLFPVVFLLYL